MSEWWMLREMMRSDPHREVSDGFAAHPNGATDAPQPRLNPYPSCHAGAATLAS
jgi:hypothetical protein